MPTTFHTPICTLSKELRAAIMTVTNVEPLQRTEEDIRELFKAADADKSGELSRTEFLTLYTSLVKERVKGSPLVRRTGRPGRVKGELNVRLLYCISGQVHVNAEQGRVHSGPGTALSP